MSGRIASARRLLSLARTLAPTGVPLTAAVGCAVAAASFASVASAAGAPPQPPSALSPDEWRAFRLLHVEAVSHNTARFRFSLPDEKMVVGLPVASCLVTRAPIGEGGKPVIRPYTPISLPDAVGHFDLLIKSYPNGVMSKGPIMKLPWKPNQYKAVGMVAGGTGITPMLQIIHEVLRNPEDRTHLTLVFGNQTPDDVLLRGELEGLAAAHPARFKLVLLVDKAPGAGWTGAVGYVTPELLRATMPPPGAESLVVVCGPPGLMKAVSGDKAPDKSQGPLEGALKGLGYAEAGVYKM